MAEPNRQSGENEERIIEIEIERLRPFKEHVRKRRDASGRCSDAYDPGEVSSSIRQKI